MFVLKEKYTIKESYIPNESELYDWWAFTAADEIDWRDLLEKLNEGLTVNLRLYTLEKFSGHHIQPKTFGTRTVCAHPNKYKNVISKSLVFWFCPDCKEEVK